MPRPSALQTHIARRLAELQQNYPVSPPEQSRSCPADEHFHPDYRRTCSRCHGKACEKMQALGLADDGAALPARDRPDCEATTRIGANCRNKVVPGMQRCKYHGGKSTGPKTAEGKARIAEAQRKRWREWRADRDGVSSNKLHRM